LGKVTISVVKIILSSDEISYDNAYNISFAWEDNLTPAENLVKLNGDIEFRLEGRNRLLIKYYIVIVFDMNALHVWPPQKN
jgi:hypothetical protein